MRNMTMGTPPIERKRRMGCMGCFAQVLLVLVLGSVFLVAMGGLFYPWSFFMGGHFHVLPIWQGVGRVHSQAGDYTIYFWIEPSGGGRTYNLPSFKGNGYLCTARGERIQLRVTGGLNEKTGIDTNGKAMSLSFEHRPWYWSFTSRDDRRPRLTFRGHWQNPDLVMDDGGTMALAFLPDGTLNSAKYNYYQANAANKVQIVFRETTGWTGYHEDCRAK